MSRDTELREMATRMAQAASSTQAALWVDPMELLACQKFGGMLVGTMHEERESRRTQPLYANPFTPEQTTQEEGAPPWAKWIGTDEGGEDHYFKDEPIYWPKRRRLASSTTPGSTGSSEYSAWVLVPSPAGTRLMVTQQIARDPARVTTLGNALTAALAQGERGESDA